MFHERPRHGWQTLAYRYLGLAALALALGGAPAAAQEGTPAADATYRDPEFGWSVEWDSAAWSEAGDVFPAPAATDLVLVPRPDGAEPGWTFAVFFIPLEAYEGDAIACIEDAPALIDGWTPSSPDVKPSAAAEPLLDESGEPIAGRTVNTAYAAFALDADGDGLDADDPVEGLDCRTLVPGRAVLLIRLYGTGLAADPAAFLAGAGAAAEMLEGLVLPPVSASLAPTPTLSAPTPIAPVAYEDDRFGFRLAYDPSVWRSPNRSGDSASLSLTNGVSFVLVAGSSALPTDALACVEESVAGLAPTPTRQNYAPLLDEAGEPVRGGDATAAFAVYTWQGQTGPLFEHVGCLALPAGRGVVTVIQNGPLAAYETEAAALATLLAGLNLAPDRP